MCPVTRYIRQTPTVPGSGWRLLTIISIIILNCILIINHFLIQNYKLTPSLASSDHNLVVFKMFHDKFKGFNKILMSQLLDSCNPGCHPFDDLDLYIWIIAADNLNCPANKYSKKEWRLNHPVFEEVELSDLLILFTMNIRANVGKNWF